MKESVRVSKTSQFIFFLILFLTFACAIPPYPRPYFVTSDDFVSQGPIHHKGSLIFSWEEDEEGFTVLPDRNRKYFYAKQNVTSGELIATTLPIRQKVNGTLVGSSPTSFGIMPHEQPSEEVKRQICGDYCDTSNIGGRELQTLAPTIGKLKSLIVLFKFSDHTTRLLPSVSAITTLMNHPGNAVNIPYSVLAPTGSVREHYLKSSYGQLEIDTLVTNWVTIDYNEAYCSGGKSGLSSIVHTCLLNALSKVDSQVNFTEFDVDGNSMTDAIGFLHSGYGAEWGGYDTSNTYYTNRIWSHKWNLYTQAWTSAEGVRVSDYYISPSLWGTSGSSIGRIGVIAHELGHYLGLPDLYDTDSNGEGIGSWSLMANSWGFTGDQYFPPPMDAWCKMTLKWVTPTVITPTDVPYLLEPQCQSRSVLKLTENFPPGEYLLIENRQKVCLYDSRMGGPYSGGLAIFHIDENQASYNTQGYPSQSGWPENGLHYKVALLQADKLFELETNINRGNFGDLYHGGDMLVPSSSASGPYPNSDSYAYQKGINKTRIQISSIFHSGSNISFVFTLLNPTNRPTPIKMPTLKPKPQKPLRKPTVKKNKNTIPQGESPDVKKDKKKDKSTSHEESRKYKEPKTKNSSSRSKSMTN